MSSGIYLDKDNLLWICNQTDQKVYIVDTSDDSTVESVLTDLNPLNIAFCVYDDENLDENSGSSDDDKDEDEDAPCFISASSFLR